jgi:hypothetical protein
VGWATHTIVGSGFERRDAHVKVSIGGNRHDRRLGRVTAELAAGSREVGRRDEDQVRVENAQQTDRLLMRGDCKNVVPTARQLTRQLRLGTPVYQQDPKRLRGWPQTGKRLVEHAAIVRTTCEHDVRGT